MRTFSLACLFIVVGCASTKDVLKGRIDAATQNYNVSVNDAWKIAVLVFRSEGTDAVEEHRDEGYMVTGTGQGMFTMGTVMAAWVEKRDDSWSTVSILTKRRASLNIVTDLTEEQFHKRFAQAVEILKRDGKLPTLLPEL